MGVHAQTVDCDDDVLKAQLSDTFDHLQASLFPLQAPVTAAAAAAALSEEQQTTPSEGVTTPVGSA